MIKEKMPVSSLRSKSFAISSLQVDKYVRGRFRIIREVLRILLGFKTYQHKLALPSGSRKLSKLFDLLRKMASKFLIFHYKEALLP